MHGGTEVTVNIENSKFENLINTYRGWVCFSARRPNLLCIRQGRFNASVGASREAEIPGLREFTSASVRDCKSVCDTNLRLPMN